MILSIIATIILGMLVLNSSAFSPRQVVSHSTMTRPSPSHLFTTLQDLSEPEQRVYSLVESLHTSGYSFRIVVVGNGAILETTSFLGPVMKLNTSPKSGVTLVTLASQDQSFEFHLQTAKVSKVALTENDAGDKVMRVIRFLNSDGAPMCSLILREESAEAVEWYNELQATYGEDLQL